MCCCCALCCCFCCCCCCYCCCCYINCCGFFVTDNLVVVDITVIVVDAIIDVVIAGVAIIFVAHVAVFVAFPDVATVITDANVVVAVCLTSYYCLSLLKFCYSCQLFMIFENLLAGILYLRLDFSKYFLFPGQPDMDVCQCRGNLQGQQETFVLQLNNGIFFIRE